MEGDDEVVVEVEVVFKDLKEKVVEKELEVLFDGEVDGNDMFFEINLGVGGIESCDWVLIFVCMYVCWVEKKGYKVEFQFEILGEEVGIKLVVYKISGFNVYGWLKFESGVYCLVWILFYDLVVCCYILFSLVWVYLVVDDNIEIEVNLLDICIDIFCLLGVGGQYVNIIDLVVWIIYLLIGIVIISFEKFQYQNCDIVMKVLKLCLYQMEFDCWNVDINVVYEVKGDVGWGNQIWFYVLQLYQMVKDLWILFEILDM